ncbi:MAG: helix-turn-helix domain-containing protein [Halioglobus sp.]
MTADSPQQFSSNFADIELLTEAMAGWDVRFLPLERGNANFQINMLRSPAAMVQQISLGSRAYQGGAPAEGFVTFGLIAETRGEIQWNGFQLSQSSIVIFPAGQEFRCVTPTGFQATSIAVEKEKLAKIAEHCQLPIDIQTLDSTELAFLISTEETNYLQRLLRSADIASTLTPDERLSVLEHDLPLCLLQLISFAQDRSQHPVKVKASDQALGRALNFFKANADKPIRIADVCRVTGTDERMLQRAFKDYLDVTPLEYLRLDRLQRARRMLMFSQAKLAISEIAFDCGFTHLGRFSGYYHQQYGELPTETVLAS